MAEIDEMEALKRAYAEMILKTAKDAAARVIAAELRARRMEQELNSTKEEAAGMLLRLKQMIDAKTKEAEITSLNQQRKHDELESQLNEAEGIILDLRAELSQAEEQLYKMNKKKMLLAIQNEENEEGRDRLFTPSLNPEPEFIAVGRPSVTKNSESDVYSGENTSVLDKVKEPSKNSDDIEIVNGVGSNSALEEKDQQTKNGAVSIVRRSLRKRKLKFWDDVMTACGQKGSYPFKKPRQAFRNLPCFRSKVKRCVQYGESLSHAGVYTEIGHDEALPENMELIDVVIKQDELAAELELTSSSRIECGVEGGTATKSSDFSNDGGKKICKYTFKRKMKRKSMVYNGKWKKKSKIYLAKSS